MRKAKNALHCKMKLRLHFQYIMTYNIYSLFFFGTYRLPCPSSTGGDWDTLRGDNMGHTHRNTDTDIHRHTQTRAYTLTHTHTRMHIHKNTATDRNTQTYTHLDIY